MDFDSLSNDEIRLRLAEFGFPSVPVTQTTRKVLVKKLKLATENQKQKTRRETIAVTKFSSDEEVEPEKDAKKREKTPNRRITLAPGEKVTKPAVSSTNGEILLPPPAARNTRRSTSGRSTPAEKPTVSSTAPTVASIQEDTDEEVKETLKAAPKRFSKSKSKTPTLTKSDTVRISYKTAEKIQEQEENDDIIMIEDLEEKNGIPEKDYISNSYQPKAPSSRQSKTTYTSSDIRRKTLTSTINPGTSITSIPSSASKTTRYSSALDTKYDRPSFTTSYNTYSTAVSASPALSSSRYRSTLQKDYAYADQEEEEEDDEDITGSAPYLSNFAKRLSTLKADPIVDAGMEKYKKLREVEQPAAYQTSAYLRKSTYRRDALPAKQQKQTVVGSFIQVLEALDRKYHIRKILYFMFVIFVIVTIYVVFFKN